MPPRPRSARAMVATTAALALSAGLGAVIGVAPPAGADPCTGAAAHAMPPRPVPGTESPSEEVPVGRKPAGADEKAPLPKLGRLPLDLLKALTPQSAQVRQQADVAPSPAPPAATPPAGQADPAPAPAAPQVAPTLTPGTTALVGWVTGPDSSQKTLERFGISGTDLGIMWDNGDPANNQVLMAFGDTYGYCGMRNQQWRYNTLFRSSDRALAHGISIGDGSTTDRYAGAPQRQQDFATQIIPTIRWAPTEKGIIPTAGVSVGTTQYVNFMSIRNWDSPGQWTTNYSGLAVSKDNGQHWGIYPSSVRAPAADSVAGLGYQPGNERFQQGAFLKNGDGFVYSYGTPPGRSGSVYLARVSPAQLPDQTKYQYWNGSAWVPGDPSAATAVVPGPVGELSVQYNTYLKQFLMLYCNGPNDVVYRTAPAPQGPWGPEQLLVTSGEIPGGIYAPFLHPWSNGRDLYYNLSLWSAYNVMLMHSVLP